MFCMSFEKNSEKEYRKIKEHKNKTRTPFIHEVEVATLCYNRTEIGIFIF